MKDAERDDFIQRLIWGAVILLASSGLGYLVFIQPAELEKEAALLKHEQREADLAVQWELQRWGKLGEGDVIKGIASDPELDITEMLERAASFAMPENCEVKVIRDSFTEIDVHVTARKKIGKDQLVAATMRFMPHCWSFVNSVSYEAPDGTLMVLGRREIEGVRDWHSIDEDRLSRMFTTVARTY